MKKTLVPVGLLAALLSGACTQFQSTREALSPTAPSLPGGSSSGSMTGLWVAADATLPLPSSCKNFQWTITSQSDTAVVGSFTAECGSGLAISANASGTLINATSANIKIDGTGTVDGLGCQFSLTSTNATIENDAITIPYTGTTCFGNVQGTEVLRRPQPKAPEPPPAPEPEQPPPPPVQNPYHIGPGPLSVARVSLIVDATGREFAYLRAPRGSDGEKLAATEELLLRVIWHLQLGGYQAGRQRNPSGAVSLDKFTVFADGAWHAYDIFTDFDFANRETRMLFLEVSPPNHLAVGGIPD